jgi:hypothetical protein
MISSRARINISMGVGVTGEQISIHRSIHRSVVTHGAREKPRHSAERSCAAIADAAAAAAPYPGVSTLNF